MTCNLNCYTPTSATPVALPGSSGAGTDIGIPGLTLEECRSACRNFKECEAIVHVSDGTGSCYGKKDIHTSAAEGGCQTQTPFVTEMICGAPWGKCTVLGDPHITPFDRKMLGSYPPSDNDLYMVPVNFYNHGEYYLVRSSQLQIRGRFGYTTAFKAAASTLGVAATGSLLGGHTLAVAYIGPSPQEPARLGWQVTWDGAVILDQFPSNFVSGDGNLNANFADMEPTDYAVRARSTIGSAPGLLPSYVFEFGPQKSVQIYVLPGPDLCNVVITMKKLPDLDGFCGNFNCDSSDDSKEALKPSGLWTPIPQPDTLFPASLKSPPGWDMRAGPSPEEIMASCPPTTEQAAACHGSAAEKEACLFDACMAAAGHVVQRFELPPPGLGLLKTSLRRNGRTFQTIAFGGSLVGCLAVSYMWWSGKVARRPSSYSALPSSGGYSLVPSGEASTPLL